MEEASAALGIHGDATRWLVRQGVLATIAGRGTTNVSEPSVRRFRERYVRAVEVACALGTSPKSTVVRLGRAGIAAAFGPPGCRQALFERADAARFLTDLREPDEREAGPAQ